MIARLICRLIGHRFGYNSSGNWRVCYRCNKQQTTDQRGMPEHWAWTDVKPPAEPDEHGTSYQ